MKALLTIDVDTLANSFSCENKELYDIDEDALNLFLETLYEIPLEAYDNPAVDWKDQEELITPESGDLLVGTENNFKRDLTIFTNQYLKLCNAFEKLGLPNVASCRSHLPASDGYLNKTVVHIKQLLEYNYFMLHQHPEKPEKLATRFRDRVIACDGGSVRNLEQILLELRSFLSGIDFIMQERKLNHVTQVGMEFLRDDAPNILGKVHVVNEVHEASALTNLLTEEWNIPYRDPSTDSHMKKVNELAEEAFEEKASNSLATDEAAYAFVEAAALAIMENLPDPTHEKYKEYDDKGEPLYSFYDDLTDNIEVVGLNHLLNMKDLLTFKGGNHRGYKPHVQTIITHALIVFLYGLEIVTSDITYYQDCLELERTSFDDDEVTNGLINPDILKRHETNAPMLDYMAKHGFVLEESLEEMLRNTALNQKLRSLGLISPELRIFLLRYQAHHPGIGLPFHGVPREQKEALLDEMLEQNHLDVATALLKAMPWPIVDLIDNILLTCCHYPDRIRVIIESENKLIARYNTYILALKSACIEGNVKALEAILLLDTPLEKEDFVRLLAVTPRKSRPRIYKALIAIPSFNFDVVDSLSKDGAEYITTYTPLDIWGRALLFHVRAGNPEAIRRLPAKMPAWALTEALEASFEHHYVRDKSTSPLILKRIEESPHQASALAMIEKAHVFNTAIKGVSKIALKQKTLCALGRELLLKHKIEFFKCLFNEIEENAVEAFIYDIYSHFQTLDYDVSEAFRKKLQTSNKMYFLSTLINHNNCNVLRHMLALDSTVMECFDYLTTHIPQLCNYEMVLLLFTTLRTWNKLDDLPKGVFTHIARNPKLKGKSEELCRFFTPQQVMMDFKTNSWQGFEEGRKAIVDFMTPEMIDAVYKSLQTEKNKKQFLPHMESHSYSKEQKDGLKALDSPLYKIICPNLPEKNSEPPEEITPPPPSSLEQPQGQGLWPTLRSNLRWG